MSELLKFLRAQPGVTGVKRIAPRKIGLTVYCARDAQERLAREVALKFMLCTRFGEAENHFHVWPPINLIQPRGPFPKPEGRKPSPEMQQRFDASRALIKAAISALEKE